MKVCLLMMDVVGEFILIVNFFYAGGGDVVGRLKRLDGWMDGRSGTSIST